MQSAASHYGRPRDASPPAGGSGPRSHSRRWYEWYESLKEYKGNHGNCLVPRGASKLGIWVHNQRMQYRLRKQGKKSSMTDEREGLLNDIDFEWSAQGLVGKIGYPKAEMHWHEMYRCLKEYKGNHGHCLVRQGTSQLGIWVNNQRRQYKLRKQGKKSSMTDERERLLNDLEFVWDVRSTNRQCNETSEQVAASSLPRKMTITTVKYMADSEEESFDTDETGHKQSVLGTNCYPKAETRWHEMYGSLKEYKRNNGNCLVPQGTSQLGVWVNTQRKQYRLREQSRKSSMTDEREGLLNDLGFEWKPRSLNREYHDLSEQSRCILWHLKFEELRRYKLTHGHCNVPEKSGPLAVWVSQLRAAYRSYQVGQKSSLTDKQLVLLDQLGFDWDLANNGQHLHTGAMYSLEKRKEYYDKCLTMFLFEMNELQLGQNVPVKDTLENVQWLKQHQWLQELKEFKRINGHFHVPLEFGRLGQWVKSQILAYKLYKGGEMSSLFEERRRILDGLGFQWDYVSPTFNSSTT